MLCLFALASVVLFELEEFDTSLVFLQKAGVLLQSLQPAHQLQHHLFTPMTPSHQERRQALLATIDALNARYGRGTVQWAACGLHASWAMRRSRLSRSATTQLRDVPLVWA